MTKKEKQNIIASVVFTVCDVLYLKLTLDIFAVVLSQD